MINVKHPSQNKLKWEPSLSHKCPPPSPGHLNTGISTRQICSWLTRTLGMPKILSTLRNNGRELFWGEILLKWSKTLKQTMFCFCIKPVQLFYFQKLSTSHNTAYQYSSWSLRVWEHKRMYQVCLCGNKIKNCWRGIRVSSDLGGQWISLYSVRGAAPWALAAILGTWFGTYNLSMDWILEERLKACHICGWRVAL